MYLYVSLIFMIDNLLTTTHIPKTPPYNYLSLIYVIYLLDEKLNRDRNFYTYLIILQHLMSLD